MNMTRTVLIALALMVVTAAALAVGFDRAESPHEFTQSDCFFCHFTLPREGDTEPLRFTDTITRLCSRCHDLTASVSHQVDMVPSREVNIPRDMPLDEEGRMTCVTCHDVHKPYRNPLTGERTFFLRRDVIGKNFCLACHNSEESLKNIRLASASPDSAGLIPEAVSHRPAMDKGHGFARFEVLDPAPELDPLSLACIDCHNDPGSLTRTSLGQGVWRHAQKGIGLSHPIGMDYYRATREHKDLVPFGDLDKRLKLFDGKIGCCTCHDPYAPNDGQALVIGKHRSFQDLCFACHIK
jgi:hypothetical protein